MSIEEQLAALQSVGKMDIATFREKIVSAQEKMLEQPDCLQGDALEEHLPLEHSFGDGLYIRKIFAPKDALIITKIHRHAHPYFVTKGKCAVLTEEGVVILEAPFQGITKAGTKRAVFILEDAEWTTVHATKETDLDKIEADIIAEDFTEFEALESEVVT